MKIVSTKCSKRTTTSEGLLPSMSQSNVVTANSSGRTQALSKVTGSMVSLAESESLGLRMVSFSKAFGSKTAKMV